MSTVATQTVRYRYRIYPNADQRIMLAKTFGCARVVYNDAIAERERAYREERRYPKLGELSRTLLTEAKRTPERSWLGEVSAVVLQQALADAEVAFRNWLDSISGERNGRPMRRPRRRRKRSRQTARFTRNARFSITDAGRLRLAKIGDVRVRWSRALPSEPSSVTVVHEADGRYYASFVVQRAIDPLPPVDSVIGVDLGLTHFATLSTGEKVDNPHYLRAAERRLAHAQRVMSRKQKGSRNRDKARRRVAVLHRKVRDKRLDHAHKLADRLIRENQAVAVEDLNVHGLGRTRLAKGVYDVGWSQFVRLLDEKAEQHGRTVVKIGRFEPTTRMCSACSAIDGPKPLSVRVWTCAVCGAMHDRDVNAARNILVAAGLAETQNACGADVRPATIGAGGDEAGTREVAA